MSFTSTDAPADPPGLDAAIEAAAIAMCNGYGHRRWDDVTDEVKNAYRRDARAAAPALRAGALREAAAKARHGRLVAGYVWADWLLEQADEIERADRIGDAT